jgi:hypothetical protein
MLHVHRFDVLFTTARRFSMTDPVLFVPVIQAEFPLLIGKEHLGISFQVRPEDAPAAFPQRVYGVAVGHQQPSVGSLYEAYKNVRLLDSVGKLGLKLVDAYIKRKDTPKGPRSVVYFWFAPQEDERNFTPSFLVYANAEFERMAGHVYVTGESFTNDNGPACIALKGIASCNVHIELLLVEGDIVSADDEVHVSFPHP